MPRVFSPEFKREAASLVLDQQYSYQEAASAMGIGLSTLQRWTSHLKNEREGKTSPNNPLNPDQQRIQELERQLARAKEENTILKKASALLMQESLKNTL